MNTPLDFQAATADHVLDAYKKGQKRVLVADEAGLGKTTVASEVVRRVKEELSDVVIDDDGLYCIIYVCCNLQIAQQNIDTLSDDGEKVNLAQSRLSMQHFVYYKKKAELIEKNKDTLVLSLTPTTSFQLTSGTGNVDERALMYACLSLLPDFKSNKSLLRSLSSILVCDAYKAWEYTKTEYYNAVNVPEMQEYRNEITNLMSLHLNKIDKNGDSCLSRLIRLCNKTKEQQDTKEKNILINDIRKVFADISLNVLKPDLVIMDEFQKFSSLIDIKNTESEENMIAQKFFSKKDTFILLLSATPYKPYTTLEELNENNNDEQYKDFHRLMDFLHFDDVRAIDYKSIWSEYSAALKHLKDKNDDTVFNKHDTAESMLYQVMGRTERSNEGIVKEVISQLYDFLSIDNIRTYIQMQNLIDSCRQFGAKINSAPVDYTKSSAYQLSFMDNYKLKETIQGAYKAGAGRRIKRDCLLLDKDAIESYSLDNYRNAKLDYVIELIFGKGKKSTGVETLLWIPASHPYYTQQANVFTKNESFSKFLVFSSWGMVPKMLSCLLSYETERRLFRKTQYTYHKDDFQLLKDGPKTKGLTIMCKVSRFLAGLYDPKTFYGKPLSEIKQYLRNEIKTKLNELNGDIVTRVSSLDIYQLLITLDNPKIPIRNKPQNAEDVLVDMAIGSPAICLYRAFKRIGDNNAIEHAEEVAKELISIFNSRLGTVAVRINCKKYSNFFQNVIDYCIQGNLQSVLDEFIHMIGQNKNPDDIVKRLKESFLPANTQQVNTIQTFGTDSKYTMRKHFALDFGAGKQNEKDVTHSTNVRSAFNSPFRPFLLASTSVGQEGLDFHWYCRKMIHWNLPSNPQDLEQREGRINRYKCLSVRRNVAKLYKDIFDWNEMFEKASEDLKGSDSEMIPYWYLPLNHPQFYGIQAEMIERIVPLYPLSEDESRYDRLIKVLSLYRLTMGQPRQEELLQMLEGKIAKEQIKQLLFDLSPFSRKRKRTLS